jgi:hypothetical protein
VENTINFFWSNTPMPWIRYLTLASFRYYNPDWNINLYISDVTEDEPWDSHPQDTVHYKGKDYRESLNNLNINIIPFEKYSNLPSIHTVDMCRWSVLASGGIFADMDIVFTNPMPDFSAPFDGISHNGSFFRIGFISGVENGFFQHALEYAENKLEHNTLNNDYQTLGVRVLYEILNCKPRFAMYKLREYFPEYNITNIPMEWIHPLPPEEIIYLECPKTSLGLHWYAGYPLHRWHIDALNEEFVLETNATDKLTELCRKTQILLTS